MKDLSALIWFSCFCCASENTSSIPRFAASDLIDSVLAVRQPLSAPICENPTTIFFLPPDWGDFSPSAPCLPQEHRKPQLTARTANRTLLEKAGDEVGGFFIVIN